MNQALTISNQKLPLAIFGAVLLVLGFFTFETAGLNQVLLLGVGLFLGLTLYHAAFGFSGAWRGFIERGEGAGLRAQILMLAFAVLLFFPALSGGLLFGERVGGAIAPMNLSLLAGAFMFGLGMQIAGACASGTLFIAGGGNARMFFALIGFIAGSFIATHHIEWWFALPGIGSFSLLREFDLPMAFLLAFLPFGALFGGALWWERKKTGKIALLSQTSGQSLLKGPWPLLWAALALAGLNFATLYLAGRPWGITSAFALWGAKGAMAVGVDPTSWWYWDGSRALHRSVLFDINSVMNFGIIIGAFLAATLAGKFAPNFRIGARPLVAAILGGILLGYGARLAYGCNIGAFFSGTASGSLHGWVWFAAAFIGNWAGARFRPFFNLA